MSTTQERYDGVTDEPSASRQRQLEQMTTLLWNRRYWLLKVALGSFVLWLGIGFLLPNMYTSTAQLMPTDAQTFTNTSVLSALTGVSGLLPTGSSLLSAKTPGALTVAVMESRTLQDNIVSRFDLLRVYHLKLRVDARKQLADNTFMEEDKQSGVIMISVTDKDPGRARDIAAAYIQELDKLLIAANTSSAHRERQFLEGRLAELKVDLDAASARLSQFSSKNATMNPQGQGLAMVEAASKLRGELISSEADLDSLKVQYSDDNVRVRAVKARIAELQSQLQKMSGAGEKLDNGTLSSDQSYPTLRELPLLGATFADLSRQVLNQEAIYEMLTKQYEIAKVQEAKELATVKVLDAPSLPERKSSPHRSIIAVGGMAATLLLAIIWLVAGSLWAMVDSESFIKKTASSLSRAVRSPKAEATSVPLEP